MFQRLHHQRIARVLELLDADVLRAHRCYFGGGTAIALRHGEYRESLDMDFMVSDLAAYRALRQPLTGPAGLGAILRSGASLPGPPHELRADKYGIRTRVAMEGPPIKFEIVHEARIVFVEPTARDAVGGVATLQPLDLAARKLLANSDRWADDGVFSRDLIDLAMMKPSLALLRKALAKAEGACGQAVRRDLDRAIERMRSRTGWVERCLQAMAITLPPAVVWQRIRALRRGLPAG